MLDTLAVENALESVPTTSENTELKVQVLKGKLSAARKFAAEAAAAYEAKHALLRAKIEQLTFEWNRDFALVVGERDRAEKWADECDQQLRNALIEHFELTGQKTFDKQLSVRVSEKTKYDEKDAVAWAESNAPVLITKGIDKKAFEVLALTQELDFVTTEKTITAVIAKDLTV